MKILELSLRAYGPFTSKVLDLSGGQQGLHVIYGPNEAGKSATLRAIHALLYGIPGNTSDNFLHDYTLLRVGGRLRLSDEAEAEFFRRKGNKNTLLDANDKALDEAALLKFLAGVSENAFSALFGIDHDELVRGGRQLVAGGGNLGENLFAAGMGLAGLHEILNGLEAQENDLFKPTGRAPRINSLIASYKDAQRQVTDLSLSGRDWAAHDESLRNALAELSSVSDQLVRLQAEKRRLERLQKAIPLIARRRPLISRLAELGEVKILPATFAQEHRDAARDLSDAQLLLAQTMEQLGRIAKSMGEISLPESLIEQADVATDLFKRYGGYVKAQQDVPGLERDRQRLVSEAQAIQKELRPDLPFEQVESMRMTSQKTTRIQEVTSRLQSLKCQIPKARKVLEDIKGECEAARQELNDLPALVDPEELRSAVAAAVEEGNLEKQLKALVEKLRLQQEQACIGLKNLRLWSGPVEELESLTVPAVETIQRFERQFEEGDQDLRQLSNQIAAAREDVDALNRQIDALRSTGEIPTEGDLTLARQNRETGWHLVRRAWLGRKEEPQELRAYSGDVPLPEAYEASVQKADHLSDRLRHEAQLVAKHATLLADRDRVAARVGGLVEQQSQKQKVISSLQAEWVSLWQPLGVSPLPPKEMRAWLQQRDGLLTQASQIRETHAQLDGFRKQIDDFANLLGQCLEESGSKGRIAAESLQAILARARNVVGQFDETAGRRRDLGREIKKLEGKLDREQRDFDQAQEDLRQWQDQWKTAVAEIGLTEKSLPAEANTVLARIQELFQKVDKAISFQDRIGGIQQDSRLFSDDRERFFRAVAPDLLELPENQAMTELNRRQAKAGQDAATLAQLQEQQQHLSVTRGKADATIVQKENFLAQLCRQAGCERVENLGALEQRSEEASGVRADLRRVDESLADHTAGATMEELIKQAEGLSPDGLPAQIAGIAEEIRGMEEKRSQLNQTIGAERLELQKMDGSAKAIEAAEQAQSLLAQIRECSERYVRIHLASVILRREITRYQDANQGPVLVLASSLFARLTSEAFSTVAASFDQADKPVLLGVRASGERVTVDGMSDGTRDQLYLALRLASLQRHIESAEPMPFIIDDILVNFDDGRAAATLKVLADLSLTTQVIFFTHHFHMVDLAKKVVPGDVLCLHSLGTA